MSPRLGMDMGEIERLCSDAEVERSGIARLYWTSEAYGFGRAIREYANVPRWLPLAVYSDHSGPRFQVKLLPHELTSGAPVFLTHRKDVAAQYALETGKVAATMPSPAVLHRRKYGYRRNPEAIGTVAFPTHRTPSQETQHALEAYVHALKSLPQEFQPVRVSLHMHDVHAGLHRIYDRLGVPVVTAGHVYDRRFLDRFYGILGNARAATSDCVGTATLYALEMGVPFFLHGEEAVVVNESDRNYPVGTVPLPLDSPEYLALRDLLSSKDLDSARQAKAKEIALDLLGLEDGLSSLEMSGILYRALRRWILHPKNLIDAILFLFTIGRIRPNR